MKVFRFDAQLYVTKKHKAVIDSQYLKLIAYICIEILGNRDSLNL